MEPSSSPSTVQKTQRTALYPGFRQYSQRARFMSATNCTEKGCAYADETRGGSAPAVGTDSSSMSLLLRLCEGAGKARGDRVITGTSLLGVKAVGECEALPERAHWDAESHTV